MSSSNRPSVFHCALSGEFLDDCLIFRLGRQVEFWAALLSVMNARLSCSTPAARGKHQPVSQDLVLGLLLIWAEGAADALLPAGRKAAEGREGPDQIAFLNDIRSHRLVEYAKVARARRACPQRDVARPLRRTTMARFLLSCDCSGSRFMDSRRRHSCRNALPRICCS
jgi:hypothetical protein